MRLPAIIISLLIFHLNSCSGFKLSSLTKEEVNELISTPAFKTIGIGLGLCDSKKNFFISGDKNYFDALDSLNINKVKDSLFYYNFILKHFNDVQVSMSNINIILKANGKELKALVDYSEKDIIRINNFKGDDSLFDEDITDYSLETNFTILITGQLKNSKNNFTLLKEKQCYKIITRNNKIINAYLFYKY